MVNFLGDDARTHPVTGSAGFSVLSGQVVDLQSFIVDITTGTKSWVHIPTPMNIAAWRIVADLIGSITLDIFRNNNATPVTSIVGGGTKPNLSSQSINQAVPSGWTSTALVADDWVGFNVSVAGVTLTKFNITLTCTYA